MNHGALIFKLVAIDHPLDGDVARGRGETERRPEQGAKGGEHVTTLGLNVVVNPARKISKVQNFFKWLNKYK